MIEWFKGRYQGAQGAHGLFGWLGAISIFKCFISCGSWHPGSSHTVPSGWTSTLGGRRYSMNSAVSRCSLVMVLVSI